MFLRLARLARIPVLGDGQQAVQPVYVGDVATTVLACLAQSDSGKTLDLVRPQPIAFADWLHTLRHLQGLPSAPLLHVTWVLVHAGAAILGPWWPRAHADNLAMLRRGHRADASAWLRLWGQVPTEPTSAHLTNLTDSTAGTTPWST